MSDLIDRQAAINTVKKHYRVDNDLLEVIVYQLENLPSAQPEPPMQIGWICPVCGRGLSPLTSVCPCNNGKGWEITC